MTMIQNRHPRGDSFDSRLRFARAGDGADVTGFGTGAGGGGLGATGFVDFRVGGVIACLGATGRIDGKGSNLYRLCGL